MPRHDPIPLLLLLTWGAWAAIWIAAAVGTKATRRRESPLSRLAHFGPLALGGLLLLWPDVPLAWVRLRLWPQAPLTGWAGLALRVAGIAFCTWARLHLGRNWSGTVTVKEAHELVRTGPYALVRHPIYTGLILAALGTALARGTLGAALGCAVIAAAFAWKLRIEERFMRETFPADYARYRAAVPALIPWRGARRSAPR